MTRSAVADPEISYDVLVLRPTAFCQWRMSLSVRAEVDDRFGL